MNINKLEIGDKFQIRGNVYRQKTFTVTGTNENSLTCETGDETIYFFNQTNFDYYADKVVVLFAKRAERLEAAKAKVAEILASNHVRSVEVELEDALDNKRFYTATSRDNGVPHVYSIKVEDAFDGEQVITTAKCNCVGFSKHLICRHVEKLAAVDAANCNREIYPVELSRYSAYKVAA